jgi:hypothetical protein
MDIRIKLLQGQSGGLSTRDASHVLKYDVWDKDREATPMQLRAAVISTIPTVYDNCGLDSLEHTEEEGTHHWLFNAKYQSKAVEGLLRIGWDSTGGTVRLTASRGTQRYAISGRTAPDFKNAIGVKGGEPEGVDVTVPVLKLVFSYKWPKAAIGLAYVKSLAGLVGTTNDATFYTFAAGELLFLGTSGEIDPVSPTDVQYHFAASKNATGLSIGEIAGIAKKGHQYLWVGFEASEDTSAKKLVQRPLGAYVETVYGESSFGTLGLGTG